MGGNGVALIDCKRQKKERAGQKGENGVELGGYDLVEGEFLDDKSGGHDEDEG